MGMEAMGKLGEIKKAREVGHKGTDREAENILLKDKLVTAE